VRLHHSIVTSANLLSTFWQLLKYFVLTVSTARRQASAVYAVIVCPSVRPSQAGIISLSLNRHRRHHALQNNHFTAGGISEAGG